MPHLCWTSKYGINALNYSKKSLAFIEVFPISHKTKLRLWQSHGVYKAALGFISKDLFDSTYGIKYDEINYLKFWDKIQVRVFSVSVWYVRLYIWWTQDIKAKLHMYPYN